jgi:hypothetical protein
MIRIAISQAAFEAIAKAEAQLLSLKPLPFQ